MRTMPRNIKPFPIKKVDGFTTNMDSVDQRENFALETRGFKQFKDGMVGERDNGTHHRFQYYPAGISIIDGLVMYSSLYAKNYYIIYGLDAANNLRIFVYDDLATTYKHTDHWVELTAVIKATIVSIADEVITLNTPLDINDAAITSIGANLLSNFIIVNNSSPSAKPTLIVSSTVTGSSPYQFTVTTVTKPIVANGWSPSGSVTIYRSTGILPDNLIDFGSSADTGRGYSFLYGTTPHIRFLNLDAQSKVLALIGDSSSVPVMEQPFQIKRGGHLSVNSFTLGGTIATGWATGTGVAIPANALENFGLAVWLDGATKYVWMGSSAGVVYKSADGGATWGAGVTVAAGQIIYGISFASKDLGMLACADGKVYKTTDGGATWTAETFFAALTSPVYSIHMESTTSAVCCIALGQVYVWNTGTWTATTTTPHGTKPLVSVRRLGTYIIACYDSGTVAGGTLNRFGIFSTDTGTTWNDTSNYVPPYVASNFYTVIGLDIAAANTVYLVVWAFGQTRVWKCTDGAIFTETTGQIPIGFSGYYVDASGSIIRVVGAKSGKPACYISPDGGVNWTEEVVGGGLLVNAAYRVAHYDSGFTSGFMCGGINVVAALTGASGTIGSGPFVGWQINKATLLPNFLQLGTASFPLTNGETRDDQDLGEGIRLKVVISEDTVTGKELWARMYITALYADGTGTAIYMESDPIAQIFAAANINKFARIALTFKLDLALVNKNLIGFNCYIGYNDEITLPAIQWIENPEDYILAATVKASSAGWVVDSTKQFSHTIAVDLFSYVLVTGSGTFGQPSIDASLARPIRLNRTYKRPRYISKASRTQGSTVVIDMDDRTLLCSLYDGAGTHEDENFSDITTDNDANRQKINLIGRGELMGLSLMNDNVIALRTSEVEIYDLQSGTQRIIGADVLSKKSILSLQTPHGLIWAGGSGIYFMPADGSQVILLNKSWQNFYNGDLKLVDNVTSFVTSAYRAAVLTGFDDFYQEVWCQLKCNKEGGGTEYLQFRYSFQTHIWTVRELNIGTAAPAVFFSSTPVDKTFVIGYSAGILKYPNQNGLFRYQDDCTVNGSAEPYTLTTASKGIPTKMLLNIGSLYSLDPNAVIWSVIADAVTDGEVGSAWYMKFYANRITTNFSSKTFPVGAKPIERRLPARGEIEVLRVEIGLDTSNQLNMRQLDLSTIVLNFIMQPRIGTA